MAGSPKAFGTPNLKEARTLFKALKAWPTALLALAASSTVKVRMWHPSDELIGIEKV